MIALLYCISPVATIDHFLSAVLYLLSALLCIVRLLRHHQNCGCKTEKQRQWWLSISFSDIVSFIASNNSVEALAINARFLINQL